MPYLTQARALDLYGYVCVCCDRDVHPCEPVYYTADMDADGKPEARVWHKTCHDALEQRAMEVWLQAANLARACGQDWLADRFVLHSQRVAMMMEPAA